MWGQGMRVAQVLPRRRPAATRQNLNILNGLKAMDGKQCEYTTIGEDKGKGKGSRAHRQGARKRTLKCTQSWHLRSGCASGIPRSNTCVAFTRDRYRQCLAAAGEAPLPAGRRETLQIILQVVPESRGGQDRIGCPSREGRFGERQTPYD